MRENNTGIQLFHDYALIQYIHSSRLNIGSIDTSIKFMFCLLLFFLSGSERAEEKIIIIKVRKELKITLSIKEWDTIKGN